MDFTTFKTSFASKQEEMKKCGLEFSWQEKEAYLGWLACSYHYVVHSTRILALAAGTMPEHLTKFTSRFIGHAVEEKGHERLLELDAKSLGYSIKEIPVQSEMKVYYRSLYYWASSAGHALGLMGWVLSLEGFAANTCSAINKIVTEEFGPKSANFLRVHSEEDPEHLNKALEVTSCLSSQELGIVCDAMNMYSDQYMRVFQGICGKKAARYSEMRGTIVAI